MRLSITDWDDNLGAVTLVSSFQLRSTHDVISEKLFIRKLLKRISTYLYFTDMNIIYTYLNIQCFFHFFNYLSLSTKLHNLLP